MHPFHRPLRALVAVCVAPTVLTLTALSPADAAPTPKCHGLKATIVGTDRADRITGTPGDDVIVALGGNDVIDGGDGSDVICGDAGKDSIWSGAGELGLLYGGAGNDRLVAEDAGVGLIGEAGNDTLIASLEGTLLDGGPGKDAIHGSDLADVIDGGPGHDRISAGGGDDEDVHGGSGNDRIDGGAGDDVLHGDSGADRCTGGAGSDQCHGGSPGTPVNSPEDDDICAAETLTSCRGSAFPDRFAIQVDGTWSKEDGDVTESATWTMDFVVRRGGRPTETWYVFESAAGSWSGEGSSNDGFTSCTWGGGGGFDEPDWSADLQLFADDKEYFLDFSGDPIGDMPGVCRNKDYTSEISRMQFLPTYEDSGNADTLPFDPTNLEIRGSESHSRGTETWTQSWTILPAG